MTRTMSSSYQNNIHMQGIRLMAGTERGQTQSALHSWNLWPQHGHLALVT